MEGTAPPPISAEMWARLRALDARCEMTFCRTSPMNDSPWAGRRRVWVATIRPSGLASFEIVQHAHLTFCEAVPMAVEEAEGRGWAQMEARSIIP